MLFYLQLFKFNYNKTKKHYINTKENLFKDLIDYFIFGFVDTVLKTLIRES